MYESPKLTVVGSVRELTLGKGWDGQDDRFLCFTWGELS